MLGQKFRHWSRGWRANLSPQIYLILNQIYSAVPSPSDMSQCSYVRLYGMPEHQQHEVVKFRTVPTLTLTSAECVYRLLLHSGCEENVPAIRHLLWLGQFHIQKSIASWSLTTHEI